MGIVGADPTKIGVTPRRLDIGRARLQNGGGESIMEAKVPVNLSIKAVPESIAAGLRARAASNHRSLQRELMAIIEIAAMTPDAFSANGESMGVAARNQRQAGRRLRPIEEIAEELDKLFPRSLTRGPSSTEIIRAMRDGRYGDRDDPSPPRRRHG